MAASIITPDHITFQGLSHFGWQYKKRVIHAVNNKLKLRTKAPSIANYDLPILYTNIPHNKLKNVRRDLIIFCFKNGEK